MMAFFLFMLCASFAGFLGAIFHRGVPRWDLLTLGALCGVVALTTLAF